MPVCGGLGFRVIDLRAGLQNSLLLDLRMGEGPVYFKIGERSAGLNLNHEILRLWQAF